MTPIRTAILLALLATGSNAVASDALPRSPASDAPADGVVRAILPLLQNDGATVERVFLDLRGGSGDAAEDARIRERIEADLPVQAGGLLPASSVADLGRVLEEIEGVTSAEATIYAGRAPGSVILVVNAVIATSGEPAAVAPSASAFPVLYKSDAALLRAIVAGGHGVFSDHNPWFASPATFTSQSPIASDPPGAGWTTWAESSLEYGLSGAVRVGQTASTFYGEASGVASAAVGNDLFRDHPRYRNRLEKAYAGWAWVDKANDRAFRVSGGRQNWQLYGGFLFSRFAAGSNAGPNPGLYLSPRTTYQRALLANARWGMWHAEAFDLDPSELEGFDSQSRYVGANLRYVNPARGEWGITRYHVPESNTNLRLVTGGTVPREGMRVWAARAGLKSSFGIDGLDLLGEYARQDSRRVDWKASAWYAQAGYALSDTGWSPHLTYRRASFSGDDPNTPNRQEAFDAQLSSGLDEWVQGLSFKKVVSNSNLDTHRVRLNFGPSPKLNFTVDLWRLEANRILPGASRHYGDEINGAVRWAITPRVLFLGVAGVAWPGDIIRDRTQDAARPWATVQASLFWGL